MSKNIYFLCLLFINIIYCYDYSDVNAKYRNIHKPLSRDPRDQNIEYKMDDSEMANVDVAGFMSPDDDNLGVHDQYQVAEDKSDEFLPNKNFESLVEANLEEYQDKNEDYLSKDSSEDSLFEDKPHRYPVEQSINDFNIENKEKHKHQNFLSQNNYKKLQKKCAFKNMKIPFFSHEKGKTTQAKKNKKRKLFNFNSKKLKNKEHKLTTFMSSTQRPTETTLFKLNKRSYLERICPVCKKKFIARRSQNKEESNAVIHNSRQYYDRKQFDQNQNYIDVKTNMKGSQPEHLVKDRISRQYSDRRK